MTTISTHRADDSASRLRISPRWGRELLLTLGAALGVFYLALTLSSVAFGLHSLVFRSGSMGPNIPTGSLALAREIPAAQARVGDIVSAVNSSGVRVTHRVVAVTATPTGAELILKGDTNAQPDATPYDVTTVDRVFFAEPRLGYVVSALTSPIGLMASGGLVIGCLWCAFRRSEDRGDRGGRSGQGRRRAGRRARRRSALGRLGSRSPSRRGRKGGAVAVGLLAVGAALPTPTLSTLATFTDAATMTSGSFSALTIPAPVLTCGAVGGGTVTINWTAVAGATGYTLTYTGGTSSPAANATSATISSPFGAVGTGTGTATLVANHNYGSVTWSSAASNTVSYRFNFLANATCST
jgi:signal peptidase I